MKNLIKSRYLLLLLIVLLTPSHGFSDNLEGVGIVVSNYGNDELDNSKSKGEEGGNFEPVNNQLSGHSNPQAQKKKPYPLDKFLKYEGLYRMDKKQELYWCEVDESVRYKVQMNPQKNTLKFIRMANQEVIYTNEIELDKETSGIQSDGQSETVREILKGQSIVFQKKPISVFGLGKWADSKTTASFEKDRIFLGDCAYVKVK